METLEETGTAVLRLFGRPPTVEDWRCVGRWSYAAAWLAEDRPTAREMVRARLTGAAETATTAAMGAGRGDADRFTLVSAIARLPEAIRGGAGTLGAAANRAIEEAAAQLVRDGSTLRSTTTRERAAFAPRFALETFDSAMMEVGQERNVLLREAASSLDDALLGTREACPALRTLRLFMQATLALDAHDASSMVEALPASSEGDVVTVLGIWLAADLAMAARRSAAYEGAWQAGSRISGDALSRCIAGLTSGSTRVKGVVEALAEDPWAMLCALAMTSQGEHASALLDWGAQAQSVRRIQAGNSVSRWATQANRLEDFEERLGVAVIASSEAREGYREYESCGGLDLFSVWSIARMADAYGAGLREAGDRSVAAELLARRETVRRCNMALESARNAFESSLDEARAKSERAPIVDGLETTAEIGAQRGCALGLGVGVSVIVTYVAVALVVGMSGTIERIAPLVVGVAALPVGAGMLAHIAVAAKRATAMAEAERHRVRARQAFDRVREDLEAAHGTTVAEMREASIAAEARLAALERQIAAETRSAA